MTGINLNTFLLIKTMLFIPVSIVFSLAWLYPAWFKSKAFPPGAVVPDTTLDASIGIGLWGFCYNLTTLNTRHVLNIDARRRFCAQSAIILFAWLVYYQPTIESKRWSDKVNNAWMVILPCAIINLYYATVAPNHLVAAPLPKKSS